MNTEIIYRFINKQCNEAEKLYVIDYFEKNISEIADMLSEVDWEKFLLEYNSLKNDGIKNHHVYNKIYYAAVEKPQKIKRIIKISVSGAALLLFVFFTVYFFQDTQKTNIENYVQRNTSDTLQSVKLSDGSFVSLQPNSSIHYTSLFNKKNREIFLKGNAEFEVAKNANVPFIVVCKDISVTALGTIFTINGAQKNTIIYLKEGKIKVGNTKGENMGTHYLTEGEAIAYLADLQAFTSDINAALDKPMHAINNIPEKKIAKNERKSSLPNSSSEKKKMIIFKNKELKDVFNLLANKYQVKINYPTEIATGVNIYLSVDTTQGIDEILNSISLLNDLEIEKLADKNYLIKKNKK